MPKDNDNRIPKTPFNNYNRNQIKHSVFVKSDGKYDMDLYLSLRRETWDMNRSVEMKNDFKRL